MSMSEDTDRDVRDDVDTSRELAAAEKKAAQRMELGNQKWTLLAAVLLYLVYLITPVAGSVTGFEITFRLPGAVEANAKVTEYVFAWLAGLGLGVFTTLTLITRRTAFGLIAWMLVTVSLIMSLLALWLRQTRGASEADFRIGIGMYLAILAVVLAVVAYSLVALRRNPEQSKIAEERATRENLDEVGYAQRDAMVSQQHNSYDTNPLFVDDRRQRATERYLTTNPDVDPDDLGAGPDDSRQ